MSDIKVLIYDGPEPIPFDVLIRDKWKIIIYGEEVYMMKEFFERYSTPEQYREFLDVFEPINSPSIFDVKK